MGRVELLFLGTGTSAGVPMIGCHCDVCSSADPRDKRNRPSVIISYDGFAVLVDTTPDLRHQCVAQGIDAVDALVFTHAHADHIMGLDDVRRFNASREGPLDAWADAATYEALNRCFGYAFKEPAPEARMFRPHVRHRLINGPFELGGRLWTPVALEHAGAPVLGFRVGNLAYCTDVSRIPTASLELLKGLDVLVLDALQYRRHYAHFSLDEAIEAARGIGAVRTLFTHIAHALGHERTNHHLPGAMQLAYDGMRVTAGG